MSKLPEICPICGEKMEKGYVFLTGLSVRQKNSLNWSKEKPTIKHKILWSHPKDYSKLLHYDADFSSLEKNCLSEAQRCPNCKVVLFGYGEEKQIEQGCNL